MAFMCFHIHRHLIVFSDDEIPASGKLGKEVTWQHDELSWACVLPAAASLGCSGGRLWAFPTAHRVRGLPGQLSARLPVPQT